jgi:Mg2+/Co2+ transporter CorB
MEIPADLHPAVFLGVLVLLLACLGLFANAETGLLSLERLRLRRQAREGSRGARRASRLLRDPERLRNALLMARHVFLILATATACVVAMRQWGETPGLLVAVAVLVLLTPLLGERLPRAMGAAQPQRCAFAISLPLRLLLILLRPLLWLLDRSDAGLQRLFGLRRGAEQGEASVGPPASEPEEQPLPEERQHMLFGLLDLEKVTVNDILIPRSEVVGIDLDAELEEIAEQLRTTTHTRLPVYRGDINQIEGVVHMRQLARLLTGQMLSRELLHGACLEPYFVPESTPLSTQLINFQKQKRRLGIVVDEYGEVLGIVTLEDILEEIIGDFGVQESLPSPGIFPQEDGTQIIDGAAHLREINRALGWKLPSEGPKTLNGLVTEALEGIPDSGVCLKIGPYRLEILQTEDNRAKRVRVWLASTQRRL